MRKVVLLMLIGFVLIGSISASTAYKDGNDLFKMWVECKKYIYNNDSNDFVNIGLFMGYIMGVIDTIDVFVSVPVETTIKQLCVIVGRYLEAHPEIWNLKGSIIVWDAIKETYPLK